MRRPWELTIMAFLAVCLCLIAVPVDAGHGTCAKGNYCESSGPSAGSGSVSSNQNYPNKSVNDWKRWTSEMPDLEEESPGQLFTGDLDEPNPFATELGPLLYERLFYNYNTGPNGAVTITSGNSQETYSETKDTTGFFTGDPVFDNGKFHATGVGVNATIPKGSWINLTIEDRDNGASKTVRFEGDFTTDTDDKLNITKYPAPAGRPSAEYRVVATLNNGTAQSAKPELNYVTLFERTAPHRRSDTVFSAYPTNRIERYHNTMFDEYDSIARGTDPDSVTTPRLPASAYKDKQATESELGIPAGKIEEIFNTDQTRVRGQNTYIIRDAYINVSSINPSTMIVANQSTRYPELLAARDGKARVSYGAAAQTPNNIYECASGWLDWDSSCDTDGDKRYEFSVEDVKYDVNFKKHTATRPNGLVIERDRGLNNEGTRTYEYDFRSSTDPEDINGVSAEVEVDVTVERDVDIYDVDTAPCPSDRVNAVISRPPPGPAGDIDPYNGPSGCSSAAGSYVQSEGWEDASTNTVSITRELEDKQEFNISQPPRDDEYNVSVLHGQDKATVRVENTRTNAEIQRPRDTLWTNIITSGVGSAGQISLEPGFEVEKKVSFKEPVQTAENPQLRLWLRGNFESQNSEVTVKVNGTPINGWNPKSVGNVPTGPTERKAYNSVDLSGADIDGQERVEITVETDEDAVEKGTPIMWFQMQANDKYKKSCGTGPNSDAEPPQDDICPSGGGGQYLSSPAVVESFWGHAFYRQSRWDVLQKLEKNCGENADNGGNQKKCHNYRALGTPDNPNSHYDPATGNDRVTPIWPSPVRPIQSFLLPVNTSVRMTSYGDRGVRGQVTNTTTYPGQVDSPTRLDNLRYCPLEVSENERTSPPLDYYIHSSTNNDLTRRCHRPRSPGIRDIVGGDRPTDGVDDYYKNLSSVTFETEANPTQLRMSHEDSWRSYELPIDDRTDVYHSTGVSLTIDETAPRGSRAQRRANYVTGGTTLPGGNTYYTENKLNNTNRSQFKIALKGSMGTPISTQIREQRIDSQYSRPFGNPLDGYRSARPSPSSTWAGVDAARKDREHVTVYNNISGQDRTEVTRVETGQNGEAYVALKTGDDGTVGSVALQFNTTDEWWRLPSGTRVLEEQPRTGQTTGEISKNNQDTATPALIIAAIMLSAVSVLALAISSVKSQSFGKSLNEAIGEIVGLGPDYMMAVIGLYLIIEIFIPDPSRTLTLIIAGVMGVYLYTVVSD